MADYAPPPQEGSQFTVQADWLAWGQDLDLAQQGEVSDRDGSWDAFFKLVEADGDLTDTNLDLDSLIAGNINGGASNFVLDAAMSEPRLSLAVVPLPFILRRGKGDHLAAMEIHGIRASDSAQALTLARAYFNILNAYLSFVYHVPLRHRAVVVKRSEDPARWRLRVYHPWPKMEVSPHSTSVPAFPTVLRLITMYADGVMTNSVAYRFLCFYKVVDHLMKRANSIRAYRQRSHPTSEWVEFNDKLPQLPTQRYDADLVGRSYRGAWKKYERTELRNAVAHVIDTESAFEPLDPEHASHYRAAGAICQFMAHHLIRIAANNLQCMLNDGADSKTLLDLLHPPRGADTASR